MKSNLAQKTGYEESQKIASGNKVSGAGLGIQTPAQCPLKSMPSDLQHPANAAVSLEIRSKNPQVPQNLEARTSPHGEGSLIQLSKAGEIPELPAAHLGNLNCEPAETAGFSRVGATYTRGPADSASSACGNRRATRDDATRT